MQLYKYQRAGVEKLASGVGGLFAEMGTGKTRMALAILHNLGCQRILVVAPLSATRVWKDEVALVWPSMTVLPCIKGSVERRAKALFQLQDNMLCVVGYESYWRPKLRKAIYDAKFDAIIYDEAHRIKGRGTRQSRFAHDLADRIPHRLALTGTPMPNGLQDAFSIFKAIDPSIFGSRWADFERRYLVKGGYLQYEIVGYQHEDEFNRKLEAHSYRVTKLEALDLPKQVDIPVTFELDAKERRVYDKLRKESVTQVEGHSNGHQVTGVALSRIVLTNILRLQQVTSGFVRVVDGRIIDFGKSKLTTFCDLLDDVLAQESHVVTFARFTPDVRRLSEACAKRAHVHVLDGSIPPEDRPQVIEDFRQQGGVLIGQVQVSSLAINLTCAAVCIFYSPDYSLTNYLQARDRLHRHGQTRPVTYYNLVAENTVDEKIYGILERKEHVMRTLLDNKAKIFS